MNKISFLLCSILIWTTAARVSASPGDLDPTFGPVGFVTTSLSAGADRAFAAARQADGKLIVAGVRNLNTVAVVRYNADGSLDTTFNADGIVTTTIAGITQASAVAVQPDGKIVVAANGGTTGYAVIRYNADGSLDATFDADGVLTDSSVGVPHALAIQADGKIITAGSAVVNFFSSDFSIVRLNPNGAFDTTFDGDGKAFVTIGDQSAGGNDFAYALALQPDGKIVVGGNRVINESLTVGAVIRYAADGTLDSGFASSTSGGGIATVSVPGAITQELNAVVIQPDGKILVVGTYEDQDDVGIFVVQFNRDGTRNTLFGGSGNGFALIGAANGGGLGQDIALQADGKIVIAGAAPNFSTLLVEFAAYRLNADGTRDSAFGANGVARTAISAGNDAAFSVVVQPDNKIVLGGTINFSENADSDIALVRFNSDGTLDNSFGSGGKVTTALSSSVEVLTDIQLQADGKIVAAGTKCGDNSCSSAEGVILRYNPNGSLDDSFDGDGVGIVRTSNGFGSALASLAVQNNGKIVAVGTSGTSATQTDALVVRYNADGSPDPTFGANGVVLSDIGAAAQEAFAVALQKDGKIISAGYSANGTREDITVWRYLGDESAANRQTEFDFDGDGKADAAIFRPSDGTWYVLQSSRGFAAVRFGISTDKPTPADFDGDGKTDFAVYRDGVWYLLQSSKGFAAIQFGVAGDIPLPADYDGDGKADQAVYRNGVWYILGSREGFYAVSFGVSTDQPVPADYDGDGKTDPAVYRDGVWYLLQSQAGFAAIQFGIASDKPVVGDYDGDGKADQAVYRDGNWYLRQSQAGFAAIQFGVTTDLPAPADFDGDGRTDLGVYRQGIWYLLRSQQGFEAFQFGASGDKPVPNAFVP